MTADLRMAREQQRRTECKKSILHAAESLIVRRGLNAVTMDDVAREAQFSKATLYRYFKDKGELVLEILIHYYDDVIEQINSVAATRKSAGEKLKLIIGQILQTYREKENISRAIMMDSSVLKVMKVMVNGKDRPSQTSPDSFFQTMTARRQKTLEIGGQILREGMASGEFRKVDVEETSILLEAIVQGYFHGQLWSQRKPSLRAETERIYDFVLRGIENKDTDHKGELK